VRSANGDPAIRDSALSEFEKIVSDDNAEGEAARPKSPVLRGRDMNRH
jgi:hypothetical protein